MSIEEKIELLKKEIAELGSCVIAFSGGVDSSLLAKVAGEVLGRDKILLVTAESETYTSDERDRAVKLAADMKLEHRVVRTDELTDPVFNCNPPDKCYYCKKIRYGGLDALRRDLGFNFIADGTNADDSGDFRPGERAAKELGVKHPLKDAGIIKSEVREISRMLGLSNWNASSQACLASRVPYGTPLTAELLERVGAAEKKVKTILNVENIRVRHFGDTAKIELPPADIFGLISNVEIRESVVEALKEIGYKYVTLDLQGYRSGSMNEALSVEEAEKARGEK